MKPQKQIAKNDCLRACIASLLEYPIEKVPNFADIETTENCILPRWWSELHKWLGERGYWFLELQLRENVPWMPIPAAALCIIFGTTARGVKHSVVGRIELDQFFPIFNPHPEGGALTGVEGLGFLIPIDPFRPIACGIALEKCEAFAVANINHQVALSNIWQISRDALGKTNEGITLFPGKNGEKV